MARSSLRAYVCVYVWEFDSRRDAEKSGHQNTLHVRFMYQPVCFSTFLSCSLAFLNLHATRGDRLPPVQNARLYGGILSPY